jgi:hypothetical protein
MPFGQSGMLAAKAANVASKNKKPNKFQQVRDTASKQNQVGLGQGIAPSQGGMMNAMRAAGPVNKLGGGMGKSLGGVGSALGGALGGGMSMMRNKGQMGAQMGNKFGQMMRQPDIQQPPMMQQLPAPVMEQPAPEPQQMPWEIAQNQAMQIYGPKRKPMMGGLGPRFM